MMKLKLWHYIFIWIAKKLLSLRYDIKIKGLNRLSKKKLKRKGGILFLPNHPAEIDPVILMAYLMKAFKPRPLVVEHFYYASGMNSFMRLVRAFPIPDVKTTANKWKIHQVEKAYSTLKSGLEKGDNFLIYPSGHLKKEGYEVIGGNSFIHRLIHDCQDATVVLIRTTGLWGSGFSRAITGEVPDFWSVFKQGFKVLLKNYIFFAPKRKVLVECEVEPEDFPRQGTRLDINKYLEGWYNTYKTDDDHTVIEEPLKLVSFDRNKQELPQITKESKKEPVKRCVDVPPKVKKDIYSKLAEIAKVTTFKIKDSLNLASDLGLDSLDIAGIHAYLDEKYNTRNLSPEDLVTVSDVLQIAAGAKEVEEEVAFCDKSHWPLEEDRPPVERPHGKTVQEAFLRSCHRMGTYSAIADEMTKVMSYKRLKLAALILSFKIRELPGKYIGILLPSSSGTYITIFATLLAGKIPAMLNWTAGARNLNYAQELLGIEVILSSHKFLSRLETLDLGDLDHLIVTLEDVKHSLSIKDKLKGLFLANKGPTRLYNKLKLEHVREDDPAVILFTSGTETFPKAVPLSHRNILENQRAASTCVSFVSSDIFYGVLPPFHSFGFNVTGLFPVLSGLKVYYSPDPTDAPKMAREAKQWKATVFTCAPSFYKNLFAVAKPSQLKTVRYFITGAEKAPKSFYSYVEKLGPNHTVIEGYGITECSPAVTLVRPGKLAKGVGQPLPNVDLCVIDQETQQVLPKGSTGEICIHGVSVFSGYLGKVAKHPFIEINGKRWYRSGDLGRVDEEGNLILEGRLKRFIKVGGEMISLNALEEEIAEIAAKRSWRDSREEGLCVAVGVHEDKERPEIVLFTTFKSDKDTVNLALRDSGFGRIVKISEVKQLNEIPLTGSGKVSYRELNSLATEVCTS